MNTILQNILAFSALGLAVAYIVKTFIWNPRKEKSSSACGTDDCGCH